ncbi:HD domain-containing phosphohydrolase [candidate division KSB1 bacterium]
MRRISIESLRAGMKLSVPIRDENDNILLNRNVELTERYIHRLKELGFQSVYISDPDLMDVVVEENLSEVKRSAAVRHMKSSYRVIEDTVREFKTESSSKIIESLQSPRIKKAFSKTNIYTNTVTIVNDIVDDVVSNAALNGLNSLKTHDNYTYQHSIDVTVTATMIGKKVQFNARQLQELAVGCLLHDIGKIFIPKEALNKNGKLDNQEYDLMKEHPAIGYEMLRSFLPILPTHVAYQHHEKQDGSGYPRGMSGRNKIKRPDYDKSISVLGEIAAIADVYDALTSDRPYRKAMLHDKVIDILKENAYSHFNAEILNSFLNIVPRYPVGSNCEVLSGEYAGFKGVIVAIDPEQLNIPIIRLLYDIKNERIKPINVNLRKNLDTKIRLIDV